MNVPAAEDAQKKKTSVKLTPVSAFHYFRLVYRSLLFVVLAFLYLRHMLGDNKNITSTLEEYPAIVYIICILFIVEMTMRFFPTKLESPGCQKQFAKNYIKSGRTNIAIVDNNAVVVVLLLWICFNAIFGALYLKGIIGDDIMLLLSCAYSVCDMICILFFCPFQSWFLKNKCCSTCRIYNWDYAMMFTPLFFVAKPYTWGLLALSIGLLIRWEVTFYKHPERFSEQTNDYLRCENCTEKLCTHKKQLQHLWKQIAAYTAERTKFLEKGNDEK